MSIRGSTDSALEAARILRKTITRSRLVASPLYWLALMICTCTVCLDASGAPVSHAIDDSAAADPILGAARASPQTPPNPPFLLGPPKQIGPVVVRVGFELHDINEIDDVTETFEFTGVMTLAWDDPRQAFEPAVTGTDEKVFQGNYQFNEVSTGWYPQVVLANESGMYQKSGVVLRIQPDGTSTLTETITAMAETELDMRWFPFDNHRLQAVFVVLGFDRDEILLEADESSASAFLATEVRIPEWAVTTSDTSIRDHPASYAGRRGTSSAFVVSVDAERDSFYIRRLVTFPLVVIVLLSFSVFWMDRSSLGDRISVSFIGILTAVTYQLLVNDVLPPISYVTLMHGFLFLSFLTMSATVVINLVVGEADNRGRQELGDRIDRACRWVFPLVYFGSILAMFGVATAFF